MVDRIIDACEQVLIADGYAATSTNRIAERAEISKGSLYQYFPDKDAVILAVLARLADKLTAEAVSRLTAALDLPPWPMLELAVTTMLELEHAHRELLRIVVEETPRLHGFNKLQEVSDALVLVGCQYAEVHRNEFRAELDVPATMWLVVETALRVSFQYVLHPKPPMPQQQFSTALVEMLARHCLA
jgi:AcrR family transcriptional regulator